jgi:hypothetical protein
MAMSLPALAVLLVVLIGGPVLSIGAVRRSPIDDLARPLKFLHLAFWGAILAFALAMAAGRLFGASVSPPLLAGVANVLMTAFYVCACFYWTAVGVLAHRLKRSWILCVSVGLATVAIGFFVTYVLLVIRVRNELVPRAKRLASERLPIG